MMRISNHKVEKIPIELIDRDPAQPRKTFREEIISEMAESINRYGQLVPAIAVRNGPRYGLLEGEMRFLGCKLAEKKTLDAIVLDEKPDPSQLKLLQLTVNGIRTDLNAIEKCETYLELMKELNWNASELAKNLTIGKSTVTRILSHDRLSPEQKEQVRRGELSSVEAYALVRAKESGSQVSSGSGAGPKPKKRPKDKTQQVRHLRCELPQCSLAIRASQSLGVDELITALKELVRLCRKAKSEKLDLSTMALVLRDQTRAIRAGEGEPP